MSTNTNNTNVGKEALEAIEAKFKDTTVDESLLGFGDTFCDWRAPLAKVAIVYAAENPVDPDKTYKDAEGNNKTAEQLKAAAEEQHNPTPLKLERLQKFYSELYPAENTEGGSTTPTEGGSTTPPAEGGSTTPPAEGGSTTPPAEGGSITPPAEGDQGGSGSTANP